MLKQADNGTFFTCEYRGGSVQAFVPAAGIHNVRNALAAIAVAHTLGVEIESAVRAIGAYKPPTMRQQIIKAGEITVIDDTYNASPDSMRGAIDILQNMQNQERKIAVLGDMLELGELADEEHFRLGRYAAGKGVDKLFAVGQFAEKICEGFDKEDSVVCEDSEYATEKLFEELKPGDAVLIKGSRGIKMDTIVKKITEKYN
jgi:UDP-N-acetylmuramyl pentapeptide synthase